MATKPLALFLLAETEEILNLEKIEQYSRDEELSAWSGQKVLGTGIYM